MDELEIVCSYIIEYKLCDLGTLAAAESLRFDIDLLMQNARKGEYTREKAINDLISLKMMIREYRPKLEAKSGYFNQLIARLNMIIENLTGVIHMLPTKKSFIRENKELWQPLIDLDVVLSTVEENSSKLTINI